jgi:hypothetical protein
MKRRRTKLKLVETPKPVPRMTSTITVGIQQLGQTIATSGVLKAIRFMTPARTIYGERFQLIDRIGNWERPIYCIDPSTNIICIPAGSATLSNELMRNDIPFTTLVLAQVPVGSAWELDIA